MIFRYVNFEYFSRYGGHIQRLKETYSWHDALLILGKKHHDVPKISFT